MSGVEYGSDRPVGPVYTPPPPTRPPADAPRSAVSGPAAGPPFGPGSLGPGAASGAPHDAPRRPPLGPHSLTAKLVVGVVSLVTVLVAVVGVGMYFSLRPYLADRLDQQLASTAVLNGGYFERCLQNAVRTPTGYYCNSGPQSQREWVAAITNDRQVLNFSGGTGDFIVPLPLDAEQAARFVEDPNQMISMRVGPNLLRVTGHQNRDGLVVVTGLSTREINTTMRELLSRELLIGSAAILVAAFATTLGVRFSLRRLRAVTTTAQDVAAELSPEGAGLDRRVPVTEKDTEVGQLAESMNTLLEAVETQFAARLDSERRMRQFMAAASHELRTPLTSIRGYAELARMQRAVGNPEDDNLSRIEFEGTRMSRLVEDLLMLARGDAADRTVRQELIDVDDLLDDAVGGVRAAFPERRIDVDLGPVPPVIGDRDQLVRVVRNLVTNAAVHTNPEYPIRVHGFAADDGVTVQVIDGGPGLPPEEAAHVFERFWRADKARTRARGGSGLGLSIVASIVRAHRGTVRFDSTVEGGSTVTLWLPGAHTG